MSASIRAEIEALAPLQKTVLQAAAVLGDPFEPELVAPTADVAESAALETLDELLERDLIRASDTPPRFHLRHPIVRRAVWQLPKLADQVSSLFRATRTNSPVARSGRAGRDSKTRFNFRNGRSSRFQDKVAAA